MQRFNGLLPSLRVSLIVACLISFVSGYLLAGWWSDANDTTPLEQICGRVDHVNSLEEVFPEQRDGEVRHQLEALVEQSRSALDKEQGD